MMTKGKKTSLLVGGIFLLSFVVVGILYYRQILVWFCFVIRFERLPVNPQGYPEFRHRESGIVFVRVPGGPFIMGSPENEIGKVKDDVVRKVEVRSFLIAKYEITYGEWRKVMGDQPAMFKETDPKYPVTQASWEEAQTFCNKLGLKLPNEIQWEYACLAGSPGSYAGTGNIPEMGWYMDNSGDAQIDSEEIWKTNPHDYVNYLIKNNCRPHPVGQKYPNAWGLYDMHGNVSEWCESIFQNESAHVVRGGSWGDRPSDCRAESRLLGPTNKSGNVGFRPVMDL